MNNSDSLGNCLLIWLQPLEIMMVGNGDWLNPCPLYLLDYDSLADRCGGL
jgi:hypothetical protein